MSGIIHYDFLESMKSPMKKDSYSIGSNDAINRNSKGCNDYNFKPRATLIKPRSGDTKKYQSM